MAIRISKDKYLDKVRPSKKMVPDDIDPLWEIKSKRKEDKKTFENPVTKVKTLVSGGGACHYKDDAGELQEMELTFQPDGSCVTAPYKIQVLTDRVGYTYTSRLTGGQVEIELVNFGDSPPDYSKMFTEIVENRWYWRDINKGGMDCYLELKTGTAELYKIVVSKQGPRTLKWKRTTLKANPIIGEWQQQTKAWDADKFRIEVVNTVELGGENADAVWDFFIEDFTSERVAQQSSPRSRQKTWVDQPLVFPLLIDLQFNESITDTNDDVSSTEGQNNLYVNGTDTTNRIFVGKASGNLYSAGFRWLVDVPASATITGAKVIFDIIGEAASPAASLRMELPVTPVADKPFVATTRLPQDISPVTTLIANKQFNGITGAYSVSSTGFLGAVQSHLGKDGWGSADSLVLHWKSSASNANGDYLYFGGNTAGGDVGTPAQLIIDYTTGGGGTWPTGNVFSRPFTGPFGGPI